LVHDGIHARDSGAIGILQESQSALRGLPEPSRATSSIGRQRCATARSGPAPVLVVRARWKSSTATSCYSTPRTCRL
jgi:hypothetical protein